MHTFWHNLRYIFQSRYFSILLTPLGHNFSTRCNWTKAILAFKFCKVFWFRFCNFSSAASLQLQLILCFGLSAFPIIDLIPLWPFPFSLMLIWNFGYHSSSAFIWFCTLRIRGSIPAQRAGLPASFLVLCGWDEQHEQIIPLARVGSFLSFHRMMSNVFCFEFSSPWDPNELIRSSS